MAAGTCFATVIASDHSTILPQLGHRAVIGNPFDKVSEAYSSRLIQFVKEEEIASASANQQGGGGTPSKLPRAVGTTCANQHPHFTFTSLYYYLTRSLAYTLFPRALSTSLDTPSPP
jgi:hypothetical protein